MMDVLSVAGSLASLIGLSKQLFDDYSKTGKDPNIAILKGLTQTSTAWKNIHNEYQNLQQDSVKICEFISDGHGKAKTSAQIAPNQLKSVMNNTKIFMNASTFEANLSSSIDVISSSQDLDELTLKQQYETLKQNGGQKIVQLVKEIRTQELLVYKHHAKFIKFFNEIDPILRKPNLPNKDLNYILKSYYLWNADYVILMKAADRAILSLLELLEDFINRIDK